MLGGDFVDYKITLNNFEGPMDLLLHLIKKSDMDICDIRIEEIAKQYMIYIEHMEELNLNIASEYLIMAAELMEIKSSMLLPKNEEIIEDEEDPRANLVERLIEYKRYKEMTREFKDLEETRKMYYTKEPTDLSVFKKTENIDLGDIELSDLMTAFQKFLDRKKMEQPLHTKITKKEYSVSERCNEIRNILAKKKKVNFGELFDFYNKDYIIVTFLSILNLAKKQEIMIKQENNFDNILLMLKGCE